MKSSPYFSEKEFDCKCGCNSRPSSVPNDGLIDALVKIREHFNSPMIIRSGYRCEKHNAKVGGAKNSQHLHGSACDFVIKGVKTADIHKYVLEQFAEGPYGIAIKHNFNDEFAGFVHLDYGFRKRRWTYA